MTADESKWQWRIQEYEIWLKMLEIAILETKSFKSFWGSMPSDPP